MNMTDSIKNIVALSVGCLILLLVLPMQDALAIAGAKHAGDDFDYDGVLNYLDADDDNDGILDTAEKALTYRAIFAQDDVIESECGMPQYTITQNFSGHHHNNDSANIGFRQSYVFQAPLTSFSILFASVNVATRYGDFTLELEDGTIINHADFFLKGDESNYTSAEREFREAVKAEDISNTAVKAVKKRLTYSGIKASYISSSGEFRRYQAENVIYFNTQGRGIKSISFINKSVKPNQGPGTVWEFFGEPACDSDGDGITDHFDLDSDNDGIADLLEANGIDTDSILALAQEFNQGYYTHTSVNAAGVSTLANSGEGFGRGTGTNLDADSDGIPDAIEAQSTKDYINIDETSVDATGVTSDGLFSPYNSDGNDVPDFLDSDSDNDQLLDSSEIEMTIVASSSATDGGVLPSSLLNQTGDTTEVAYREVLINASDDTPALANGVVGDSIDDLFENDTINGAEFSEDAVVLSKEGIYPVGVDLDSRGALTIAANTASGTYPLHYKICQETNPSSCDTARVILVIAPSVHISLSKTNNRDLYIPGATSYYVITVTNSGPDEASQVVVGDTLPDGLELSSQWNCSADEISNCADASGGEQGDSSISAVVDIGVDGMVTVTVPVKASSDAADYN